VSRGAALAAVGAVLWLAAAVPCARAQSPKPWVPPGQDSVQALVSEAKVRFREVRTDTITEQSIVPFERVGQAARRLMRRIGRNDLESVPRIEGTLDSLGLDTDVVHDPAMPNIVLVLIRNPSRPSMQAVGYLLWYRGVDLRMQGMSFPPAVQPRLRAWWSAQQGSPYSVAVVYRGRSDPPRLGFKYLRLSGDGFYWDLVQYEGNGPELGVAGDVAWADLNADGRPELLSYSPAPPDSVFTVERPVHPVTREVIYTEGPRGFRPHDARYVPGPLETLHQFLVALRAGDRERATRLLVDPAQFEAARAAGWATARSPRSFVVDRQQEGQPWPEWLGARVTDAKGTRRWVFHFTLHEGLWLIKDWIAEGAPRPDPAVPAPPRTGGQRP
jgi:hypothetical protein